MLTADGKPVVLGALLGRGGQGEVHAVTSHPGMVCKTYFPATMVKDPSLARRLAAMIATRPPERRDRAGHLLVSWPEHLVMDGAVVAGYLMPQVDRADTVELHRVTNPSDRRAAGGWASRFSWRYLVRTAGNLALATQVLHRGGTVIGDFNLKNILVSSRALITLIDCDSMQITDPATGERFFCPVGMAEFQPPELKGADLSRTVRHPSSDHYALAIHLYQLLMEGEHPFRGVWNGVGDKPDVPVLARDGMWAGRAGGLLRPRPAAIGAELLPPDIREMFRRAFEDGAADPGRRPTADEWHSALVRLEGRLRQCAAKTEHWYDGRQPDCPWCAHENRRPAQVPLPPAAPTMIIPPPAAPPFPPLSFVVPAPPQRRRRSRAAVLAVIAVAGLGIVFGGRALAGSGSGNSSATGGPLGAYTQQSGSGADSGTTTGSSDPKAEAVALRKLLAGSKADRKSILRAIPDARSCGDPSGDAQTFRTAQSHRSTLRDQVSSLDLSALDGGPQMKSELTDAFTASAEADGHYADWADGLSGSCSRSSADDSGDYAAAFSSSQTADKHKKAFVTLWNPICQDNGWPAITDLDI